MPRARLLVVTPSLGGGGAERHLVRILPALAERFAVAVATLRSGGALEAEVPAGIGRHAIDSLGWITAARRLRRIVRASAPAAVLGVQEAANIPTLMAVRTLGADRPPTAVSTQSAPSVVLADSKATTRARVTLAMRRLYPLADRLIAPTAGVGDDLVTIAGIGRERVAIIPNAGVDDAVATRAAAPVSHRFLDDPGVPVLVACGRLTEQKDYPTFVAALARLAARRPVRAIVLGDGPQHGLLTAAIHAEGLDDVLDLAGYTPNPYPVMARASVFVLSSRSEGFGNVLAEALALGVPIVSTDCPYGPREILEGGRYGRLVPPGDPEALAEGIAAVLDDPEAMADLRARGPARAARFTAARSGAAHVALLEELLADRRGPGAA